MSKYGVFWSVFFSIHCEYRKIRTTIKLRIWALFHVVKAIRRKNKKNYPKVDEQDVANNKLFQKTIKSLLSYKEKPTENASRGGKDK